MDDSEIKRRIDELREEHRDLDSAIEALRVTIGHDQLRLARLKKRKLLLRDELGRFQDMLLPDIIA